MTVLDKDRRPVRGLTAADFTVIENGRSLAIVDFTSVELPPPVEPSAPWMRDVAPDVVRGDVPVDRVVAIGRYELRVAAESLDRAGSVFTDVEVPDYASTPLSASGLVLTPVAAPAARGGPFAGLLDATPTIRRDFDRADRVAAVVRVYQGSRAALATVPITRTMVDQSGRTVIEDPTSLDPARFTPGRAADDRFELPIARLTPGEYLLRVDIGRGERALVRTARFTVR